MSQVDKCLISVVSFCGQMDKLFALLCTFKVWYSGIVVWYVYKLRKNGVHKKEKEGLRFYYPESYASSRLRSSKVTRRMVRRFSIANILFQC